MSRIQIHHIRQTTQIADLMNTLQKPHPHNRSRMNRMNPMRQPSRHHIRRKPLKDGRPTIPQLQEPPTPRLSQLQLPMMHIHITTERIDTHHRTIQPLRLNTLSHLDRRPTQHRAKLQPEPRLHSTQHLVNDLIGDVRVFIPVVRFTSVGVAVLPQHELTQLIKNQDQVPLYLMR